MVVAKTDRLRVQSPLNKGWLLHNKPMFIDSTSSTIRLIILVISLYLFTYILKLLLNSTLYVRVITEINIITKQV